MDVSFLFPEATEIAKRDVNVDTQNPDVTNKTEQNHVKSFGDVVSNNVCDIPLSQFPTPCLKGDRLAITIPEDEYKLG